VELWPLMHLGIALGGFVAAALGLAGTGEATRANLDGFASDPLLSPMASALERILAGDRGPELAAGLEQPSQRAAVTAVLRCLNDVESAPR
ncbi:hypothetical protein, partial [Streptomyces graminilatus]|uniref:hypothetical protein n=1 Tax=Streptomyces graminilatus TaxID=1464070 RepID=UPI000A4EA40F